jgi:hypothetical protein
VISARASRLTSVGFVFVLAGLLCVVACGGGAEQVEPEEGTAPDAGTTDEAPPDEEEEEGADEEEEPVETSLTPLPRRTIELYFPSLLEDGLVSEYREIFATATPGDQIKQILADLITGPTTDVATRALPGGTRLRQAYVLGNGIAWLDFSSELAEGIGGGSMVELLTVYSVVNSVAANVPEVRRVGFLVNGRPVETLNGHIHLLKPVRPNFSLILGSITVTGPQGEVFDLLASTDTARRAGGD